MDFHGFRWKMKYKSGLAMLGGSIIKWSEKNKRSLLIRKSVTKHVSNAYGLKANAFWLKSISFSDFWNNEYQGQES